MSNSDLEKSILQTIVFYDILGVPLTGFEIYKYLIQDPRSKIQDTRLKFSNILEAFGKSGLLKEKTGQREGFYFLSGRDGLVEDRIGKQKIADAKWRKLRRFIGWFQGFPFVKMVLITGSLALGNVRPESDFDILTVAKNGRIWTTRFLTTFFFWALGLRRSEKKTRDKICLNHYLADGALEIKFKNLYEAQAYARFLPVLENEPGFYVRFCRENMWIGDYLVSWPENFPANRAEDLSRQREIKTGKFLASARRFGEWLLGGRMGDWLESELKKIQLSHIRRHPLKDKAGSRIIADDTELEFHPELHSKEVMRDYRERLRAVI